MAVEEVVNWATVDKDNPQPFPSGPSGQRQIGLSTQQIMGAIARWRDTLGTGDVTKVGTPANNQVGVWTGNGTIEGDARLTFDIDKLTIGGNIGGAPALIIAGATSSNQTIEFREFGSPRARFTYVDSTNILEIETTLPGSKIVISPDEGVAIQAEIGTINTINYLRSTFFGRVETAASTTNRAGFNIPEGSAPTSPVDGDFWVTAGGAANMQLNGSTVDLSRVVPAGAMFTWPTSTVPDGYFERDGTAKNMAVYEDLYDVLGNNYGLNAGTTFTAAADDIITATAHGLVQDDIVEVTTSAADLPAGLTIDTKYYVLFLSVNTFSVSLTLGGAAVNIADAGTGTHRFHDEYLIPDSRGRFPRYWDHGAGIDPDAASRTDRGDGTTGDNVGTLQDDEFESHTHTQRFTIGTGTIAPGGSIGDSNTNQTGAAGGNETRGINIYEMPIIKY